MSTKPGIGRMDHPVNIAGERLEAGELSEAFIRRVRDELAAGPATPAPVRHAVRQLAGLGHTVEVQLEDLEEFDGVWFGGGHLVDDPERYVAFTVSELQVAELTEAMAYGPPTMFIPPAHSCRPPRSWRDDRADRGRDPDRAGDGLPRPAGERLGGR